MIKIAIVISGGVLQAVYANQDIQYVLVDYDDIESGGNLTDDEIIFKEAVDEIEPHEADSINYHIWEAFEKDTIDEKLSPLVHDRLKELNF